MTDRRAKHAEDYKAFEAGIISDFDAQSAVERGLVQRRKLCLSSSRPILKCPTTRFQRLLPSRSRLVKIAHLGHQLQTLNTKSGLHQMYARREVDSYTGLIKALAASSKYL